MDKIHNTIITGDCLNIMEQISDNSVDLVFYDPPYNVKKKYDNYTDNLPDTKYSYWMRKVYMQANRISKRGVVIFIPNKHLQMFLANVIPSAHTVVVKKGAAGVKSNNYMIQYFALLSNATPVVKCKDLWDDIRLPGEGYFFREERYPNPGMTSVELIKKVIHHFTEAGELVFDPFMGCGATAQACLEMNRHFAGTEISEKYCKIAWERLTPYTVEEMEKDDVRNV